MRTVAPMARANVRKRGKPFSRGLGRGMKRRKGGSQREKEREGNGCGMRNNGLRRVFIGGKGKMV